MLLTRAIVERGAPDITPWHKRTIDKSEKDGRFFCDKAPGVSLLAVVPYAAMRLIDKTMGVPPDTRPVDRVRLHMVVILLSGLAAVLATYFLFRTLLLFDLDRPRAELLAGAYAMGTIVFPFATVLFGHTLAACLITAVFFLLTKWKKEDGKVTPRRSIVIGLLLACSVVVEYPTGLLGVALGVYYLSWGGLGLKHVARTAGHALLGAFAPLLLHSLFLYWAFGSPFKPAYKYMTEPVFLAHTSGGLLGIGIPTKLATFGVFLSTYRGIFFLCPFLALTFAGFARWIASGERRRELVLSSALILLYVLFNCSYYAWDGGGSTGPRHLVPALAFFILGIAYFVKDSRWRTGVAAVLIVPSVCFMFACTSVCVQLPEDDPYLANPLYQIVLPAMFRGELGLNQQDLSFPRFQMDAAYNMGTLAGLTPALSLLVMPLLWLAAYAPSAVARKTS
jgi:hypothetical protein